MHVTMYMSKIGNWKSLSLVLLALLILGASIPSIQSLSTNLRLSSTGTISYTPGIIGSNVWTADFETGDLSQFDGVEVGSGNLLEATPTVKYNGNYGMHIQKVAGGVSKGAYELTSPMTNFHFSFAYRSGTFSASSWVRLFELRATTGTKLVWMDYWAEMYFIGGKTGHFDPNDGNWHVIDIFVNSDVNGMAYISVDGNFLVSINGGLDWTDSNGDPYQLGKIEIGILTQGGECSGDLYYDDVKLDEWTPPEAVPQPPIAVFFHYPTTPEPNEGVSFDASHSYDIDNSIISYSWNFGDGTTGSGINPTHTFAVAGVYTVTLTVQDESSYSSTMTSQISVETRSSESPIGWSLPLRTSGKSIVDSGGRDVTLDLMGASKMGIEYGKGNQRESNPDYYEQDSELMQTWGVKLIRVPFNRYWYLTDLDYRNMVKQLVDTLASKGILTIMDLHRYGEKPYTGQLPAFTTISQQEAWELGEESIKTLEAVAHDFLYQPMVVGVEINEYRPKFDEQYYEYKFRFELISELAQRVHQINPNLLVGIEIGYGGGGATLASVPSNVMSECKSLIDPQTNIVYMPHCYITAGYGRSAIWATYGTDPTQGKTEMYDALDSYYKSQQDYYNVPIIVTEWGSEGEQGPLVIADQMDYYVQNNWGGTYWAWFRAGPVGSADGMGLLCDDWETPSFAGEAFQQKLTELF